MPDNSYQRVQRYDKFCIQANFWLVFCYYYKLLYIVYKNKKDFTADMKNINNASVLLQ